MLPERNFSPSLAEVTLVLLSGQRVTGFLGRFSPQSPDLTLQLSREGKARNVFAAEHLALVGIHRPPGKPPPLPSERKARLKIHLMGGSTFLVDPVGESVAGAVGLYAVPTDPQCPYQEIFFYNHAINLRELNEPLGSLLLQGTGVGKAALEAGLKEQQQSRTPIGEILVQHHRIQADALQAAAALQARRGTRIGEVLIESGLAKPEDIEFALKEQRKQGGKRIGQVLIDMKVITEMDLARALARKFQLPFVDLDTCAINLDAVSELPRPFVEKHAVLPVDVDPRTLTIALSDPLAVDVIDQIRVQTGKHLSEVVVTREQLSRHIPRCFDQVDARDRAGEMDEILKGLASGDPDVSSDQDAPEPSVINESDNSIIKLANQIIIDAYRRGASDIHVEPNGKDRRVTVRFRIDGDCVAYQDIPAALRLPLVARIKIMAQLDMTERRKPQDGKIRFRVGERQIELRVATIPTVNNNEDLVLRILAASKPMPLDQMGLSTRNLAELRRIIAQPYGLILCVGPTGSGKTTTLHSVLGAINTVDTKIWTAEDPVEITQAGLRQVQVNPKIGFTFAAAMRAFLRADPDVIMVGEMRDPETAATAIEASLTGHLVLSTLHTNSAPETLTRLTDMGLEPFSFADALLGVVAQRLARALCRQCRTPRAATATELAELAEHYGRDGFAALIEQYGPEPQLCSPVGCPACSQTGYKGRIGLHELLINDDDVRATIQHKASIESVRKAAQAGGMTTLLQDGIEKTLAGKTDLKQVLAVCSR